MLPLLKPVAITVIVVQSVAIYNDFTNPLYYLPGKAERRRAADALQFPEPVQQLLQPCCSMGILLTTIPPLIVYLFFNRQIVAGMTAGAVKG